MSDTTSCCATDTSYDSHWNDPGQDAIYYRIGTWSDFYSRMKFALSRQVVDDPALGETRPLAALSTRAADDPTIALLDAAAVTLDVLTFYQERIANEGFLRTATERQSVLWLARAIGYELAPGVAASVRLAFTVEDASGAPGSATIPVGLPVMHIPGQDETPQTFETAEEREVRAEWNALTPIGWEDHPIDDQTTEAWLAGVTTRLQPGDAILIVGDERKDILDDDEVERTQDERWDFRVLTEVETDPTLGTTRVAWTRKLGYVGHGVDINPAEQNPVAFAFRIRTPVFGHNAMPFLAMDVASRARWYEHYTGEDWPSYDESGVPVEPETQITEWPGDAFHLIYDAKDPDGDPYPTEERWVDLDGEHKSILPGSWVVFAQGPEMELGRVISVSFLSRTDFGLTSKVTRVELDTRKATIAAQGEEARDGLGRFRRRRSTAFAATEALSWSKKPITTPFPSDEEIAAGRYELSAAVDGLEEGWYLFVQGTLVDEQGQSTGETGTELLRIETLSTSSRGNTVIAPETPLQNRYLRSSVSLNANVLLATHGETVSEEVLGSGDGSTSNQRFTLRRAPLTFVSAATASGRESTLTLRVDGVRWTEVSSLYDQAEEAEVYTIRVGDDQKATVAFGDGLSGARLPNGQENVRATYRFGLGEAGNVRAQSLQLMKRRPLGVRSVTNPIEAKGGEDPESLDEARVNAPLTVLTLDRLVSLSDYEDFARAFAGVAKAKATSVWAGELRKVHLTIAGVDGAELGPGDETWDNLLDAIQTYRDPTQRVEIEGGTRRWFRLRVELRVDEDYVADDVYAAVQDALAEAFSFDAREFGQSVTAAEIVALIQGVAGVVAVDLNSLAVLESGYDPDEIEPDAEPYPMAESVAEASLSAVLTASRARWNGRTIDPAEILLLDPSPLGVVLEEMSG